MKFTINWLKKHLDTDAPVAVIVTKLNEIGMEVESISDNSKIYEPFIIAEILEALPHPNADRLKVCKVSNGSDVLQIVCGANNARAGIKVVLAPIDSIIPAGNFMIKQSHIRGVDSCGMLCSYEELKLKGNNADGIIELGDDAVIGMKFSEYADLNEVMLDISLTPNRGDCASVLGIARDLHAAKIGTLRNVCLTPYPKAIESNVPVVIEDQENCQELALRQISGVRNTGQLSDAFMKSCLNGIEYQFKTPLVDVSNFMMFDLGRPNHIYDADKIKGAVAVRKSSEGEIFHALDGKEYKLPSGLTVIADAEKILSIAGVIGGELSKIDAKTTNILIEVGNFHPHAVMTSGRALNIITDSRFRFERNVDFANTELVMNALTEAILKNCGGIAADVIKVTGKNREYVDTIHFDYSMIKKLSGHEIAEKHSSEILQDLGFIWKDNVITVPSWRVHDVEGQADIVEEILRIYGLSNIPSIELSLSFESLPQQENSKKKLATLMLTRGMNEFISWSFCSENTAKLFADDVHLLKVSNPISIEMSTMRPSIIASLLPLVSKNIDRGRDNLKMFEIGNIYSKQYKSRQTLTVCGIRAGFSIEKDVHSNARLVDFFDVKDDVQSILLELGLKEGSVKLTREVPSYYHPGKSACFKMGPHTLALCGELHPGIAPHIKSKALFGFEVFLDNIPLPKSHKMNKEPLYDFQSVSRDFAFILTKEVAAGDVIQSINSLKIKEIEAIKIFDIYAGQGIQAGCKSVALSVILQPRDRTFTDAEIEKISSQIVSVVNAKLDGVLRQ